jgi:hypothetical protein
MRAAARRLPCLVLLAGCASGQGGLALPPEDAQLARARAECAAFVTPGDGSEALRAGLEQGGLASLYLIIRGAADGALLGAVTGGGAADGAWIGAAVGAGLGLVVGLVAGVGKMLKEQRRHRAAYEACVAGRVGIEPQPPFGRRPGPGVRRSPGQWPAFVTGAYTGPGGRT